MLEFIPIYTLDDIKGITADEARDIARYAARGIEEHDKWLKAVSIAGTADFSEPSIKSDYGTWAFYGAPEGKVLISLVDGGRRVDVEFSEEDSLLSFAGNIMAVNEVFEALRLGK